jgi:SAM-dependent methyltransferase
MDVKLIKKFGLDARKLFKKEVGFSLHEFTTLNLNEVSSEISVRIDKLGIDNVIEHVAYTWFNRLCVIRYMELNDKLAHGFRVLSHPSQTGEIEIIAQLADLTEDFGLDKSSIVELMLAGNNDEALYRKALLGQCQQLAEGFPFLFGEQTAWLNELLPNDLLRTNSIVRFIESGLDESYWQSLDVFSEIFSTYYTDIKKELPKKIGKESLAKATQITEPKWISRYMVENTLARRWLELSPTSTITENLAYYLADDEQQSEAVKEHIASVSNDIANPQDLNVLDPACGSGRNLLIAYNLLIHIYLEKGYRSRDIPSEIFENNIVGFDIDERAIQVSSLILTLRALEDDRRFLTRDCQPTLLNLADVSSMGAIAKIEDVDTSALNDDSREKLTTALSQQYDVIVTYPPNLGIIGADDNLMPIKIVAKSDYPETKSNLATMFFSRALKMLKPEGFASFILKDSWLFMSRYEQMRNIVFDHYSITSLAHIGRGVIPDQHQMNAVIIRNAHLPTFEAKYCFTANSDLIYQQIDSNGIDSPILPKPVTFPVKNDRYISNSLARMSSVPTKPLSYWARVDLQEAFSKGSPFKKCVNTLSAGKNIDREKFVRHWWELESSKTESTSGQWKPLVTGGEYRRWYGNINGYVDTSSGDIAGLEQQLQSVTNSWTALSPKFNAREVPEGAIYDPSGPCFSVDTDNQTRLYQLGLLNSVVFDQMVKTVYPEGVLGSIRSNDLAILPIEDSHKEDIAAITEQLVAHSLDDWNSIETAKGFEVHPLVGEQKTSQGKSIEQDFLTLKSTTMRFVLDVNELEVTLNKHVADSYDMLHTPLVKANELSFYTNPYFESGVSDLNNVSDADNKIVWQQYQSNQISSLLSYIIGCVMGRYSLEQFGVMYADKENTTFKALLETDVFGDLCPDDDGIVPLACEAWIFEDDATAFVKTFIKKVWGEACLVENIKFIAESLTSYVIKKVKGEQSEETIRRYLTSQFYKQHVSGYQRKPIYWLFSSGKEKAFECLVYLNRYNDATLSRMRTEYVRPLLVKYDAQLTMLSEQQIEATGTETRRIEKDLKSLEKKQAELRSYDDELKHYAEMCITLDLDNGVKANYGKFGNLLADVKTIHGKAVK